MTSEVIYKGNLRTQWKHIKSGSTIITDAPTDNSGKGEAFSPTDTVASALAGCIFTIMGIKANHLQIDLTGMKAEVTKHMSENPRKISQIDLKITIPTAVDEKTQNILENVAKNCPVAKSLHPDIIQNIEFHWNK